MLWERGQPLSVEEVELAPPGPGEVLVEIKAAGVCHSDLHPAHDDWPIRTPIVLGHEGAGIVRDVGDGVLTRQASAITSSSAGRRHAAPARIAVEGRAVLCERLDRTTYRNKLPSGGTKLRARGQDVAHFLSTACFAQHAVVPEEGAVRVSPDVPFDALATVGCAVVTGVGAVTTAARAARGSSVAIIGAGGVGLNVAQGAAIAGCASDHRDRSAAGAARTSRGRSARPTRSSRPPSWPMLFAI